MSFLRTSQATARSTERLIAIASRLREERGRIDSTIRGSSMSPTIAPGTGIQILLEDRDFESGRVVAFVSGERIIAHRIIGRGRGRRASAYWITRGDATIIPDPPVREDSILGRVMIEGVPPPPAPDRSRTSRAVGTALLWFVSAALQIHVRLAHALVVGMLFRFRGPHSRTTS